MRELLSRPRDAALGTAGELAGRIGVHEATASRLARKLGFESYADFREALREEFILRTDPAMRVSKTLSSSADGSLLADLVRAEQEALAALPGFLAPETLERAASALTRARKVFVYARGNAEALAVLMDRRMRRMGIDSVVLGGDARDLAERLAAMSSEDALLAFAFRRPPRHWRIVLDHAGSLGATRVVIADLVGASLAPSGDHLLFAPRSGSEERFQTLTVPMAISNAVILQMARLDEHRSLQRLERVGRLLETFGDG